MSPDHHRIVEHALLIHPHQAISPPPPTRPRRIAARALCLGPNRPARARQPPPHKRVERVPRLLAFPAWHHAVLFARKQRIRRPARTGARGVDAGRGRAHALLHLLAHSRVFVDAVERGKLDHDGCRHGQRQLSGLHHCPFSPITVLCPE